MLTKISIELLKFLTSKNLLHKIQQAMFLIRFQNLTNNQMMCIEMRNYYLKVDIQPVARCTSIMWTNRFMFHYDVSKLLWTHFRSWSLILIDCLGHDYFFFPDLLPYRLCWHHPSITPLLFELFHFHLKQSTFFFNEKIMVTHLMKKNCFGSWYIW